MKDDALDDRPAGARTNVLLGVSGGIAAYKAAALCSALVQRGDCVDVVMTKDAERFVGTATFAALTRRPTHRSLWEAPEAIEHIALARRADVVAIVPATANVIAKIAHGLCDDLLSAVALATRAPLVVAPAMNSSMYDHPATQANLQTLQERGVTLVPPGEGFLAEREAGVGRLAEQSALISAIDSVVRAGEGLAGERVLITAGPTREALDPVRFLSNASTGTIGIELAREALKRGATVDLVLGPTTVPAPFGARVVRVGTAEEMLAAALARADGASITIAAAAVLDWRPARSSEHKIKKEDGPPSIALERTPDVLATLGERKNGTFLVGFAAETENLEQNAREKIARKHLDAIAVNDVSNGAGFGTGESELILLWEGGRKALGRGSKRVLARAMWDALAALRVQRTHAVIKN